MLTIHAGRTRRLWSGLSRQIAQTRSQGVRCVLLVPEQYTLQAERDLIAALHLPGFFDIEVFSLSRFVQRLFDLSGAASRVRVDGNGKNIALSRALMSRQKQLKYYSRSVQRRGFISQCGEWIADMKRADISPQRLSEYAASLPDGAYHDKLSDLGLIYSAYSDILSDKFVDGEDALLCAMQSLPASRLVSGADVFVYGFDMITNDFGRLLCAIAGECREAHVYLVMEREDAPDGDCFQPVRQSAERLRTLLRQHGIRREWLWDAQEPLHAPEDIQYLERRLLQPAPLPYPQQPQHIMLFEAATPYSEAHFIAQEILVLQEQGVPSEDICVLCGDLKQYAPVLSAVFASYDIPAYLAMKEPLLTHGLVRLLLASVRAATSGCRTEDLVAIIKSDYAPIGPEEGWALENYLLKYGISGKRFHAPFTRGDEAERRLPEMARSRLSSALLALQTALREAENAVQSLTALMDYLNACDAYQTLLHREEALIRAGMDEQAVRARQVWSRLLALLEQMHEIAGGARIPGSTVIRWLEAGLMDEGVSSLPPTSGCVTVGEIGNLIVSEPRVVFACGLHSGMNDASDKSLLTPEEQQSACSDMQAYLGMTGEERNLMAELDVWKALSSPRDRLYLSHAQATQAGAAQRPAQVIATIRRLFPRLTVLGGLSSSQTALHPSAPLPALDAMGARLRSGMLQGEWLDAWKWLLQSPDYRTAALHVLSAAQDQHAPEALSPVLARELFTERLISVSRLESYATCPYQHFVTYGLKPQERKEWTVTPSEKGSFYHAAMEGFTRALPAHPQWPCITREECNQIMDEALAPLTDSWADGVLGDSARARAQGRRYISVCKRVAWAFTRGAKSSRFRPDAGEVSFGYPGGLPPLTLTLSDGERVSVRGRIDRIDRYDSGESVYLRVIDYKSGVNTLEPSRIYLGMQLQLLLYLEAAMAANPGALPAGAFYQWMGDPLIDQQKKNEIENAIAKRLCLKGIMLSDVQVARWMDDNKPPINIEDVFKKDDTPKKGKLVCSLEELNRLISQAHAIAVHLTEEIRKGVISPAPVCDKSGIASCQQCAFAGVCRRDERMRTHDRMLPSVTLDDLIQNFPANA